MKVLLNGRYKTLVKIGKNKFKVDTGEGTVFTVEGEAVASGCLSRIDTALNCTEELRNSERFNLKFNE